MTCMLHFCSLSRIDPILPCVKPGVLTSILSKNHAGPIEKVISDKSQKSLILLPFNQTY